MSEKNRVQMVSALLAAVLLIMAAFCGCMKPRVETSSKYMVGFVYNTGPAWGRPSVGVYCAVRYNKSIDVSFSWYVDQEEKDKTLNFKLTDEQYKNITRVVDPQKLYYLDPECNEKVQDGTSLWLYIYGPDDDVLKRVGGYSPRNERFRKMVSALYSNVPAKLDEVYTEYSTIYLANNPGNEEINDLELSALMERYSDYVSE